MGQPCPPADDDGPWVIPFPRQGRCVHHPARRQRTIRRIAVVTGVGYWTGETVTVEFRPAAVGSGRRFVHHGTTPTGGPTETIIPARAHCRVDAQRRTNLAVGSVRLEMVEHVMAALAALEIDNCEIHLDGREMPGLDGSSWDFTEALVAAGITTQDAKVRPLTVTDVHRFGDDQSWIEVRPTTRAGLTVQYELDFPECRAIGRQVYQTFVTPEIFRQDLAPARTFIRQVEAQALIKQGLATHVDFSDLLVFGDDGPIGNELRYPDECVRHKILDLIGDLALAERPIQAEISAYRSGHRLNGDVTEWLVRHYGDPSQADSESSSPALPNHGVPSVRRAA